MSDFGKSEYERARADGSPPVVRLRPSTDELSTKFKANRAIELLETNNEVQIVVVMRGREKAHSKQAHAVLEKLLSLVVPAHARLISNPESDGARISCTIASVAHSGPGDAVDR